MKLLVFLQSWPWTEQLLSVQGIAGTLLLIVAVVYSIRIGSTKAWKERAEERKEAIADRDATIVRLREQLEEKRLHCVDLEREQRKSERQFAEASQLNFELQGRVRKYERLYGSLSQDPDS